MIRAKDLAGQFLEKYEQEYIAPPELIETPTLSLDPGHHRINILTAPPGAGKSAFALQTAAQLARQGVYSMYFSYEMSEIVIFTRILSHLTKFDKQLIEQRKIEPAKIKNAIKENASVFAHIAISLSQAEKAIRQDIESIMKDPDISNLKLFLFFDYLQRMNAFNFDDPRLVAEKTMNLITKIAADYYAAAFVISSANRNGYDTAGLDASRNSGQIEFDADTLTLLQLVKFDEKSATWQSIDKKDYASEQSKSKVYIQSSVIKNRHGAGMQKVFLFDKPIQTFSPVTTIAHDAYTEYTDDSDLEKSMLKKTGRKRGGNGSYEDYI